MRRWNPLARSAPRVAVIRLGGVISTGGRPGVGLNDAGLAPVLERAFGRSRLKAVALSVNSPGGSPVQSSLIGARVRRLAEEKGVPVYAFVEDVAASGGYWLAAAADEIWVDESSVVGSIGVISASFGAHDLIERWGIERRVYTAGKSKSMLDPFRPEKEEDVARLRRLLDQVHESFIGHVKARRGGKLDETADLFSGEIWVGRAAVDVGLADGVGHLVPKMKALFGDRTRFEVFGPRRSLWQRLGMRIGARVVEDALGLVEERALFARYGL